jgi:DNA repair protein RadD
MWQLRDYQERAVNEVRTAFASGSRAPLLVLPTGGGKTVIFSYIAANVAARGKRALILVHRVELLRQTADKLREAGAQVGLINPNYTPNLRAPIQVASVQTLVRRKNWVIPDFDLIVTDEAHHVVASTYKDIINRWPNAWNLGVTATPVRGDGLGLGVNVGGVYDRLILGPQVSELIDRGYLVRPVIYAPKERLDLAGVRTTMGDYNKSDLLGAVDKPSITGNAVQHYTQICPGAPAVAFCVSIAHATHVCAEFQAAGYRAAVADGSMEDEQRRAILGGLATGAIQVVCSCDLISEGTDIPAITAAILLRPTQSLGLYIQQVGRALRPSPGKPHAYILDHVGNVLTHGLPEERREWSLDGEEKKRRKKNDDAEAPIKTSMCDECFCVHAPAPTCPECGYVYPPKDGRGLPEQVAGELTVITEAHRQALRKQQNREVAQARTEEELRKIAKDRGYKDGWVRHMLAAREAKKQSY